MLGSNTAPSHSYVKAVNESGGIQAARSMARPSLEFKGPPPPATAPHRPSDDPHAASRAPVDNKAAAARLRANIGGGSSSDAEKVKSGSKHIRFDEQGADKEGEVGGEEEGAAKRLKGEKDADVSSAVHSPTTKSVEEAVVVNVDEGLISAEANSIVESAAARAAEAAESLKAKLEEMSKEKADMFDVMIEAEGRIRLDEQGGSPYPLTP